jgi:hypothetical protein
MHLRSGKNLYGESNENMVLRSGTQLCYSNLDCPLTNEVINNHTFDDWLINRMKNIVAIMNSINTNDVSTYWVERARVLDEFCYLLTEYFDHIVCDLDEPTLNKIVDKLREWVKEITSELFTNSNYAIMERNYLGNVRASIVSLQVRLLNSI